MSPDAHPVIGIFASDHGPGDAERATIMSQTGSYLARKGARLACVVDIADEIPVPLLTSARTAGGEVILIGDESFSEPNYLSGVTVEHAATAELRLARLCRGRLHRRWRSTAPGCAAAVGRDGNPSFSSTATAPSRWSAAMPPISSPHQ